MVKKKFKETSSKRLEKMKAKIKAIEDEAKLQKELKEAEKKLKAYRKPKTKKRVSPLIKETFQQIRKIPSEIDISKLDASIVDSNLQAQAVKKPKSSSERMWVMSMWENRKTLDPNFDPDNWFRSSVYMDNKNRSEKIDNFWTGRNEGNTDNFWTGSMWGI